MRSTCALFIIAFLISTLPNQGHASSLCPMLEHKEVQTIEPVRPFAPTSIWNRRIAPDVQTVDVHQELFGDTDTRLTHVYPDLVTLCTTDANAPETSIEKSEGWSYPARSRSSGEKLYMRHLSGTACGCTTWSKNGNNLFVLINPATMRADLGVGGWRIENGALLNVPNDGKDAHNIDVVNGSGEIGYGRASLLPALGGLIRLGELNTGIGHAIAIAVPAATLSSEQHFIAPARAADAKAFLTYRGDNIHYTMGTQLILPAHIDIENLVKTPQGKNIARAAQTFGFYIVDTTGYKGHAVALAMEDAAARFDLGFDIQEKEGKTTTSVDPAKVDGEAFNADIIRIFESLVAVVR